MGNGKLVQRKHSHVDLAEQGVRLRMVEIRDRIHESRVLDLAVAMAVTGKDLVINQDTMELEEVGVLDAKVKCDYIKMLTNKLISNAVAPKEIEQRGNENAKWIDALAEYKLTENEEGE